MAEKTINIGGRLHSTATGNVVTGANEIFDDSKGKTQAQINANTYSKEETYNKNELNNLITTPDVQYITVPTFNNLPESGSVNTIYRVSNWDGGAATPAVDASKYSEYAWDGSKYVLLSVKSAVDEVFDVSVFNAESGVAKAYETLTAALNGVPANCKKGGMSIKFIQTTPATYNVVKTEKVSELPIGTFLESASSIGSGTYTASQLTDFSTLPTTSAVTYYIDSTTEGEPTSYTTWVITLAADESNEYVQYRLMSTAWSTNVRNWRGVDDEPTAGSDNLVKSGGVDIMKDTVINNIERLPHIYSVNDLVSKSLLYSNKIEKYNDKVPFYFTTIGRRNQSEFSGRVGVWKIKIFKTDALKLTVVMKDGYNVAINIYDKIYNNTGSAIYDSGWKTSFDSYMISFVEGDKEAEYINIIFRKTDNSPINCADIINNGLEKFSLVPVEEIDSKVNSIDSKVNSIDSKVNERVIAYNNRANIPSIEAFRTTINSISNYYRTYEVPYNISGNTTKGDLDAEVPRAIIYRIKIYRGESYYVHCEVAEGYQFAVAINKNNEPATGGNNVIVDSGWINTTSSKRVLRLPDTFTEQEYGYVIIAFREKNNVPISCKFVMDSVIKHLEVYLVQNELISIDTTPTEGSTNPITSGGVYEALQSLIPAEDSSDILVLNPEKEYLTRMKNFIRPVTFGNGGNKQLVLAHFSDIHASKNNLERIIKWCNHYSNYIDDIIHTGDSVDNVYSNDFSFWENTEGASNILNCIGNHDCSEGSGSISANITEQMCYDKFFANNIANWGVNSAGEGLCYYYKDYVEQKVRLVVLDYAHFNENQSTWMANIIKETLDENNAVYGFAILTASHSTPQALNTLQCSFSSPSRIGNPESGAAGIATIINDYQQQGGEYIAHISGHVHRDRIGTLKSYPNQIQIQIDAARTQDAWMDKMRIVGDRSQDLFNIISIDTTEKVIRLLRIGAQYDRFGRKASCICYRYADYTNTYGIKLEKGIMYDE